MTDSLTAGFKAKSCRLMSGFLHVLPPPRFAACPPHRGSADALIPTQRDKPPAVPAQAQG